MTSGFRELIHGVSTALGSLRTSTPEVMKSFGELGRAATADGAKKSWTPKKSARRSPGEEARSAFTSARHTEGEELNATPCHFCRNRCRQSAGFPQKASHASQTRHLSGCAERFRL